MLPDHCSTRGVLTQHVPTLTVTTRSILHAAISSGDSSSSTPMISMLQQHFNITLPSFLPSHCTYVINRRDTVPERTAWTKAEGNIWGRVGEAAAWRWREPRQRVRMPEGSFFQQACGSPGEIVMLILHLLCIKADENIKQQEGGTQKWKEHEGKKMQAWQEEESPDGAGGEKGNPCLWAPWLSSLAWKTSADKRSLLFCPGSNKNISCFFLLEKKRDICVWLWKVLRELYLPGRSSLSSMWGARLLSKSLDHMAVPLVPVQGGFHISEYSAFL